MFPGLAAVYWLSVEGGVLSVLFLGAMMTSISSAIRSNESVDAWVVIWADVRWESFISSRRRRIESFRGFFLDPFPVDFNFLCSGDCIGSTDVSESPESLDEEDEANVLELSESGLVSC